MVKTRRARNKIRQFFRAHYREQNIEQGKQMIENELREAGYDPFELMTEKKAADVAQAMHYSTADDMYAAIGFGDLAPVGVRNRFTADIRQKEEDDRQAAAQRALLEEHKTLEKPDERAKQKQAKASSEGVVVEGVDNLLVRLSHCCDPVPGDEIIGYITKGRGSPFTARTARTSRLPRRVVSGSSVSTGRTRMVIRLTTMPISKFRDITGTACSTMSCGQLITVPAS